MPKVRVVTCSKPEWIELLAAAGWEVRTLSPSHLASGDHVSELDAIILDGGGDFPAEAIRHIHETKAVPLLVLLPDWTFANEARAVGADEVMVVPLNITELLFRLHSLIHSSRVVRVANLVIDLAARRVKVTGRHVRLTPIEFRLLACLAEHIGQVVSRDQILRDVWGYTSELGGTPAQVKNSVSRLRKKIEPDPYHPQYLVSIRGGGYRLRSKTQWEDATRSQRYQT